MGRARPKSSIATHNDAYGHEVVAGRHLFLLCVSGYFPLIISWARPMTIDLTSKLFILLAAYTLLHAAFRFWQQSRNGAGGDSLDDSEKNASCTDRRRRMASGIHRSPSRHQMFLLAAMLMAAAILAALLFFSSAA